MIDKLTKWRANHAKQPHSNLYPLTYAEIINAASLAWWSISFIINQNLMDRALAGTPIAIFAEQHIWTGWMLVTLVSLCIGYWIPQIRAKVGPFVVNGRSLGLIMSTGIWTMFSSFLWILSYNGIMNVTYTSLAFVIFVIGTKVLAYER